MDSTSAQFVVTEKTYWCIKHVSRRKILSQRSSANLFHFACYFFSIQINTSPDFMDRNVESQTFCEHDGRGNHSAWILFIWKLSGRRTSIIVLAVTSPPPPSLSQRLFAYNVVNAASNKGQSLTWRHFLWSQQTGYLQRPFINRCWIECCSVKVAVSSRTPSVKIPLSQMCQATNTRTIAEVFQ